LHTLVIIAAAMAQLSCNSSFILTVLDKLRKKLECNLKL